MSETPRDSLLPPPMDYSAVVGAAAFAAAAQEVVDAARHDLALMTVDLDRRLFGTDELVQRLRNFILQHRRARFRVLVHEPAAALRNSVRLIEFGRMLSSRVEFRTVPVERRKLREEYLIADERALLYRSSPDQLEAKHYVDAPMVARSHLRAFEALWHESTVARELSSLGI